MPSSLCKMKYLDPNCGVGLTAVAFSGGQPKGGVEKGPQALLDAGLLASIESSGAFTKVHYKGKADDFATVVPALKDDPPHDIMKKPRTVGLANEALHHLVYEQSKMGRFALNVGGDHSIAMGTVSGIARATKERLNKDLAVIWIDAHADINTPETTDTGNIHGMPLAFLLGLVKNSAEVPGFAWLKEKWIKPEKLVYIGLRDVDKGERRLLKENNIKCFSMHDVDKLGIQKVVEMAIEHVSPNGDTPIHLSYDVDALDPSFTPSTGTPVPGGLTYREGRYIAECIHATGAMVSMDLVEVNPTLGTSPDATVRIGCSLIRSALGETLLELSAADLQKA